MQVGVIWVVCGCIIGNINAIFLLFLSKDVVYF
jgi:hypothetical protein